MRRKEDKSEVYFFLRTKNKIMSTEEKQEWTQEELEAFLQEQEQEEQEWEREQWRRKRRKEQSKVQYEFQRKWDEKFRRIRECIYATINDEDEEDRLKEMMIDEALETLANTQKRVMLMLREENSELPKDIWLDKEWKCYFEIREHMLSKRGKNVTGMILNYY